MKIKINKNTNIDVGDIFRIGCKTYTTAYIYHNNGFFRLINLTDSTIQEMAFDIMEDMFDANFRNCEISVIIKKKDAVVVTPDELGYKNK